MFTKSIYHSSRGMGFGSKLSSEMLLSGTLSDDRGKEETLLSESEELSSEDSLSSLDSDWERELLSAEFLPKGSFGSPELPKNTHAAAPRPIISTAQITATIMLRFVCLGFRIFIAFGS